MSFDAHFQRAVLRLMQLDEAFCSKAVEWISPGFFTIEALGWVFKTQAEYFRSSYSRPTEVVLRNELKRVSDDKQLRYLSEIESVLAHGSVPERDYIRAHLKDFVRRQIFVSSHRDSQLLFNAGQEDKAYDCTMRAIEQMQRVEFDKVERAFFFEEFHDRERARAAREVQNTTAFTTGIPLLDASTDGGVQPGELWCVFAYPKRGKTTWLINQGFLATFMHVAPTLHIQLEGSKRQVEDRYEACFANASYRLIKRGEVQDGRVIRDLTRIYAERRRLLVIRVMNEWDVTMLDVQAELQSLRSQHGFVPKVLLVDYMDLLRSRHRVDSETQHQVDAARDLKRLVNQHELAAWSAWQAQRPKLKDAHQRAHILTSKDVADAFAKVRIVDAFASLNATDEELKNGEMRFYMESHRDAEVNAYYLLRNDIGNMRMAVDVERLKDPSEEERDADK